MVIPRLSYHKRPQIATVFRQNVARLDECRNSPPDCFSVARRALRPRSHSCVQIPPLYAKRADTFRCQLFFGPPGGILSPSPSLGWTNVETVHRTVSLSLVALCALAPIRAFKSPGQNKTHHREGGVFVLVRPEGFEPPSFGIGIHCDIQLRHGRLQTFIRTSAILHGFRTFCKSYFELFTYRPKSTFCRGATTRQRRPRNRPAE